MVFHVEVHCQTQWVRWTTRVTQCNHFTFRLNLCFTFKTKLKWNLKRKSDETTGVLWQSTKYMHCTFSHTHNNLFVHLLIQVPRFYLRGKEFDDAEFSSLLRILPRIPDELRLLDCGITPPMMERLSQRLDETEHHVSNIQCTTHVGIRKSLK